MSYPNGIGNMFELIDETDGSTLVKHCFLQISLEGHCFCSKQCGNVTGKTLDIGRY